MATPEELVTGLATRLGMESPEPDEGGLYTFMYDGELPLFLRGGQEGELLLFAGLGTLTRERAGSAAVALLQANHFWLEADGFTLCMIPATLNVMLAARTRGPVDAEGLFGLFDRFAIAAAEWRKRLPEMGFDLATSVAKATPIESMLIPTPADFA